MDPANCSTGEVVPIACKCQCAKDEGEPCGGWWGIVGKCASHLTCKEEDFAFLPFVNPSNMKGVCLKPTKPDRTALQPCDQKFGVKGPCKAFMGHFSYNKKLGRCQRFLYGGCGGNKNNWSAFADCKSRCGGRDWLDVTESLFTDITDEVNIKNIDQCNGEGMKNCRRIDINQNVLDKLKLKFRNRVKLLPGLDIILTTLHTGRDEFTIYVNVDESGNRDGLGELTFGKDGSVNGFVREHSREDYYVIENCGHNCNILAERDGDLYVSQFGYD